MNQEDAVSAEWQGNRIASIYSEITYCLATALLCEVTNSSDSSCHTGKTFVRSLPGVPPIKGVVKSYEKAYYKVKYLSMGHGSAEVKLRPVDLFRSWRQNKGLASTPSESLVGKRLLLGDSEVIVKSFRGGYFRVRYENGVKDKVAESELSLLLEQSCGETDVNHKPPRDSVNTPNKESLCVDLKTGDRGDGGDIRAGGGGGSLPPDRLLHPLVWCSLSPTHTKSADEAEIWYVSSNVLCMCVLSSC